jgi:hypothetical protein
MVSSALITHGKQMIIRSDLAGRLRDDLPGLLYICSYCRIIAKFKRAAGEMR